MLAYAASRPTAGKRQSSPNALLLVISAHIALVAAVMSARMELPPRVSHPPTTIINLPRDSQPPPPNTSAHPQQHPLTSMPISDPRPNVPLPHFDPLPVDPGSTVGQEPVAGGGTGPQAPLNLVQVPVRHEPRLLTPPSELRPPYPPSKILSEEEAVLRLRLTINETGRVTSVDPVGTADREFLDAARRYLIAHWRYQPASEDGRAVASSTVITLRFQLDG